MLSQAFYSGQPYPEAEGMVRMPLQGFSAGGMSRMDAYSTAGGLDRMPLMTLQGYSGGMGMETCTPGGG